MIPFLDIKSINQRYIDQFQKVQLEVINSGQLMLGPQVQAFENEFASYCGVKHCVGVSNGLDALRLIWLAYIELGILSLGDEVIVPANTYIATIMAISQAGLTPVLVEPDPETYNLNIGLIEKAITINTKAICVVHLYGHACFSEQLRSLAKSYKLLIVEDSAQAHGASFKGQRVGSLGDAAGFSFYPGKNLGAIGDAGAVTTNNSELADMLKMMRNYGSKQKYYNEVAGYNFRLDELQAAFLRIKLKDLDTDNEHRRKMAELYDQKLAPINIIKPQHPIDRLEHVWHLYVIRSNRRDKLQKHLNENGIQTLIHYPISPHKQLAYNQWNQLSFPITEQLSNEVLSLPISPVLSEENIQVIAEALSSNR